MATLLDAVMGWCLRRGAGGGADRGRMGEVAAARFLERAKGYRVLARNWRSPVDRRLELDLVASDRGAVVFVEVKVRSREGMVPARARVNRAKRRRLRRAAVAYLARLRPLVPAWRLDAVIVELGTRGEVRAIEHHENLAW